jgi:muramoyltetrapeptide carboxypeptidase
LKKYSPAPVRKLRAGAKVAVVAPSGPFEPRWLDEGCRVLAGWGLDLHRVPPRDPAARFGYLAAADRDRAASLQAAWLDPQVEAVFCARGGYGSQRMVDLLDWAAMASVPAKLFVGFSDVTALHEAFWQRLRLGTLLGPNVASPSFAADQSAQQHLKEALFAPGAPARFAAPASGRLVPGLARGITAGGNLTLIAAGLGSADGRERGGFAGCIVLLEDVGEQLYRLDRMLTQLLRAGALEGAAAIALGSWTRCGDSERLRELMLDRLEPIGVPVAGDLGFGHCPAQRTIPLGVTAELDGAAATLTIMA